MPEEAIFYTAFVKRSSPYKIVRSNMCQWKVHE